MVVELGHFALILALMLAAAQAFFGLAGPALQRERWLAAVPSAACGQFVFIALAVGVLVHAFVSNDFSVRYANVLPDLFREGAGVVAHGRLDGSGTFIADEVLAKHDEKYMPPEVARSLKQGTASSMPAAAAAGGEPR